MRRRSFRTFWFSFGCIASAVAGGACVDIFHSTDFAEPTSGPIDFCSWDEGTAQANATRACALLSACQSPVGDNAAGTCLVNATLAYDCVANPNRPVIGEAHDYWECLAKARSCEDIAACIYATTPGTDPRAKAPQCGGQGFTICANGPSATTRLDCPTGRNNDPASGESCLATGHACFNHGEGEALCLGSEGTKCGLPGCNGTELNFCVDAGGGDLFDRGVDCASYGAGKCVAIGDAGLACLAVDGGACTAKNGISCNGSIALGCGSGVQERVDCSELGAGTSITCNANPTAPAYDVAAACFNNNVAMQCSADTCSGNGALLACVRGAVVTIDCASLGLGACGQVTTTDGMRGACKAP